MEVKPGDTKSTIYLTNLNELIMKLMKHIFCEWLEINPYQASVPYTAITLVMGDSGYFCGDSFSMK